MAGQERLQRVATIFASFVICVGILAVVYNHPETRSSLLEPFVDIRRASWGDERRTVADRSRILQHFARLDRDINPGHERERRGVGGRGEDYVRARLHPRRTSYAREEDGRSERAFGEFHKRSSRTSLEEALKRVLMKWVREGEGGDAREGRLRHGGESVRITAREGRERRERKREQEERGEEREGQQLLQAIAERVGIMEDQRATQEEEQRARMLVRRQREQRDGSSSGTASLIAELLRASRKDASREPRSETRREARREYQEKLQALDRLYTRMKGHVDGEDSSPGRTSAGAAREEERKGREQEVESKGQMNQQLVVYPYSKSMAHAYSPPPPPHAASSTDRTQDLASSPTALTWPKANPSWIPKGAYKDKTIYDADYSWPSEDQVLQGDEWRNKADCGMFGANC
mmetsp:Transcript_50006/g.156509  ORF Transcript_50006/g.156509 Transcript_50006/m.156509 type:complete len:407 (-) Transcript_50006:47-1267(-)